MKSEEKLEETLDPQPDDQNNDPNLLEDGNLDEQDQNDDSDFIDDGYDDDGKGDDLFSDGDDSYDDFLAEMSDEEASEFYASGKLPIRIKKRIEDEEPSPGVSEEQPEKLPEEESESKPTESTGKEGKEAEKPSKDALPVDYKAVYEEIMKPFKANGKEIQPRSAKEVVSLMQMGADYTRKMQKMAEMRKIVESLDHAGINKDSLNFLIDLHKGDKDAIKKHLTQHNINPLDLNLEETSYTPKNHLVDDKYVVYAEALEDMQEVLPTVETIIKNKWDSKSREILLTDEQAIRGLGYEIQVGRFDYVQAELERRKTFGMYRGISDIDAYTMTLRALAEEQQNQLKNPIPPVSSQTPNTPKRVIPDTSKKGAAPNRVRRIGTQVPKITEEEILNMSDEDLLKLNPRNLV